MKLRDGIIDCPITGNCKLDISKICKCFGFSVIIRFNSSDTYRLSNPRAKVKITLSKEDAKSIIEKLHLVKTSHPIFNSHIFMTQKRFHRILYPKG